MIELRLLGSLDLRNTEGTELRSILSQPKRVALLAYLAVQGGGGFHRRDRLLALFWPESDTDRARGALRRALYFLRQSLGEGVILSRGDEEVGIDPARLRCDAAEFVRLLDAGNPAQALDLYGGDLLESFFISEAPEFEAWLEEERQWLRGRAAWAAWTLTEEAEAAGEIERALPLARRALTLSGEDEPAVRKWMALLARSGDPAGALRAYDELVERLTRDYELDPAPETRALAEEVRAGAAGFSSPAGPPSPDPSPTKGEGRTPDAAPSAEQSPLSQNDAALRAPDNRERGPGGEGLRAPGGEGIAWRPPRAALLLPLLALVLLSGAVLLNHLRSAPAPAPAANVIAVLPFSYHGSQEFAYLAEGIVRMLSTNLNGAGELRSVDPRALLNAVDQASAQTLDARHARALAERFGAGHFVLGHIMEAGGRLRITAIVYDQRSTSPIGPSEEVTVEGEGSRLFELVDELTTRLLAGRSAAPQARLIRLAALTTHSLPALKAYLEGESEYRAGRYAAAIEAFRRAVASDSSFALAYYRLSGAAHWSDQQKVADSAQVRALRYSYRLARHNRLLVEAWPLYRGRGGGPTEAERLYRTVLLDHPDDIEAWFQLGEVQYHWGPSLGRPATEAREAFERVLAFEPANVGALIHLARIAADEDKTAELDSLVSRILAVEPEGGVALQVRALRAFALGDRPEQERILRELGSADEHLLERAAATVATRSGDPAGATELVRLLTAPVRTPLRRAQGHVMLAQLELARGRWSAARAELLAAEPLWPTLAVEVRGTFASFPFLRLPAPELDAIRRDVAGISSFANTDHVRSADTLRVIYAPRQLYLLGLLSTRLRDSPAALRYVVQLDRYGGATIDSAFSRDFAGAIQAQVAWTGGHAAEALRQLGEPRLLQDRTLPVLLNYTKADERWLRAELLRSLGREEDALRVYASFPDPSGYDLHYLAPSHLRRAEIHERRGERAQAAEHYRRFLELWRDADPELRPLVTQARERLRRLEGG